MATNQNLLGVRDELKRYGVTDERIGWDGEYVTIDGKRSIKPTQLNDGRAYADQSTIASAVQPFQQMQQQVAGGQGTPSLVPRPETGMSSTGTIQNPTPNLGQQMGDIRTLLTELFPQQQTSQVDQRFNDILNMLQGRVLTQQTISMDQVLDSPQYAAQQAQMERQAQQAVRQAQEALGAAGLGRSTRLQDRAQSIQNDANEYINKQVIPSIMQGLQSEQERQTSALTNLLDVLGSERQFQQSRQQNELDNILNLLGFQTNREDIQYERDYRQGRDAVADQRYTDETQYARGRDQIADQRYDDQTQYARGRDQVADQRYAEERAYQMARDAIMDERYKMEFDENARRFGLNYALDQARLNQQISDSAAGRALQERGLALEERSLALREQEAESAGQADMEAERRGMVEAIRGGQLTPGQALQRIDEDLALGFYTPEQAALLKQDLQRVSSVLTPAQPTPEQTRSVETYRSSLPSDSELDAEARRLGYPILDYRSYAKDPKGQMTGISFEQWRQLYGPKIGG